MKKTVLTGGKFNRVHKGHIWLLKKAKRLGFLIVVLANDVNNKRAYALPASKRKKTIEELKIADKAVVGGRKNFVNVVKKYKPNVIVLGYDQRIPDKETEEYIKKNDIRVVRLGKYENYSTRRL
jgi:D-beta-D-heptose 7-phosphate kinase/D-beta-D-heptose 1-phosphate adenosyltransferase